MRGRLILVEHEVAETVLSAYRAERDAVRRSHLQVIWLLASGETIAVVSRVSGYTGRWIRTLIGRWNAAGVAGLGDRRRDNAGAAALLDEAGLAALAAALEGSPADGGVCHGVGVGLSASTVTRNITFRQRSARTERCGTSIQVFLNHCREQYSIQL